MGTGKDSGRRREWKLEIRNPEEGKKFEIRNQKSEGFGTRGAP